MNSVKKLGKRITEIPQFVSFGAPIADIENEPIDIIVCTGNMAPALKMLQPKPKKDLE